MIVFLALVHYIATL